MAGSLTALHGDPADRMIYATAQHTKVPLVTKDAQLTEIALSVLGASCCARRVVSFRSCGYRARLGQMPATSSLGSDDDP